MNIYGVILQLLHTNNGCVSGKTNIHKNIFLAREMLASHRADLPVRFVPYFYGPFSSDVSNALDLLESSGLVKCREIDYSASDELEMRKFEYELTERGLEALQNSPEVQRGEFRELASTFERLRDTGLNQQTRILATAAKIRHLLSQEKKPLTFENIKSKAKTLGWQLRNKDLEKATKLLVDLQLAKLDRHSK